VSIERPFELQVADLWDSVLNLSLPEVDQIAILAACGDPHAIDELALAFDDAFWVVAEAYRRNQLGQAEMVALDELNSWLNEMSGQANASKWTQEALIHHADWERVRQLARRALAKRQLSRVQRTSA
jgi:hypothetical protein